MSGGLNDTTARNSGEHDASLPEQLRRPLRPFRVLHFEIREELGRGGMGVVYKAWDETLQRDVTVKFFRQDHELSDEAKELVKREARAAAAVKHANIVTIYQIDEEQGVPFIVMEYVDGNSVQKLLSNGTRWEAAPLLELILQIVDGLQAAHACGIVHRDIKPSNVLIESVSGRAKILDFGLARVEGDRSLDGTGAAVGTPAYMSPEQVNGEKVDQRSDLFSLGCLIHALVVGRSPFQAQRFSDTATRILTTNPPALRESNPNVPLILSHVVSRLLEKNPNDRFQSAQQVGKLLREALAELQRGEPLPMADTIIVDSRKRRQRQTLFAVAGVALTALLVLVIGAAVYLNRPLANQDPSLEPASDGRAETGDPHVTIVALNPEAGQSTSLSGALAMLESGNTIRVLDTGPYSANIRLEGLRNVTIEAMDRAVLVPLQQPAPLVELLDCENITLRGFDLKSGQSENAVRLLGCSGIRLEDLNIEARHSESAAIRIENCNAEKSASPLVISGCRIEAVEGGQCLWVESPAKPLWNFELRENQCLATKDATAVVLWCQVGRVTMENNLISGGTVGLNMRLTAAGKAAAGDIRLVHNTFFHQQRWLGLLNTEPLVTPFTLQNNLILESGGLEVSPEQRREVAEACLLGGNIWEISDGAFAAMPELSAWALPRERVDVLSRDSSSPKFLRPLEGSELHTAGTGDAGENYVGAFR